MDNVDRGAEEDQRAEPDETEAVSPGYGGLWWGATMSSLQVEGVAPAADWSVWEREKRVPASDDGNGFATNFNDDIEALASLGLSHLRITLEWARLEPEPGRVDESAYDRYIDILTAVKRAGLSTIVTLHHGTLPGWFSEDTPGFRDARERDLVWGRHVDRCAERFESLVDIWAPIDDPIGWAIRSHLLGSRPPGVRDLEQAMYAAEGALLASFRAWELLRSGTQPVMGVFGTPTIFGVGPESESNKRAWHDLIYTTWISAFRDGELLIPHLTPRQMPELADAFDLIGIVHDHPIGVTRSGSLAPYPENGRRSDTGFTPIVDELGELLSYLASELPGRKLVVAGHGVATTDDEWREEILRDTVSLLCDAKADGLAIEGYLHDTGIDGYEGPYGFSTTKGLLTRGRVPRDSAAWLRSRLVTP